MYGPKSWSRIDHILDVFMINNSAQGIVRESITLYVLLKNTRTVESSSEDLRKQAREEQQVSDFD